MAEVAALQANRVRRAGIGMRYWDRWSRKTASRGSLRIGPTAALAAIVAYNSARHMILLYPAGLQRGCLVTHPPSETQSRGATDPAGHGTAIGSTSTYPKSRRRSNRRPLHSDLGMKTFVATAMCSAGTSFVTVAPAAT